MVPFKSIYRDTVAYFMTAYATDSPPSLLEECVETYLAQTYASGVVADFMEQYFKRIKDSLVEEFNQRYEKRHSLRYKMIDEVGDQIAGIGRRHEVHKLCFQDALNTLSPSEFEALSAHILRMAGCVDIWKTPESHDQGIDAFGYMPYLRKPKNKWPGAAPRVAFLAQAKHFKSTQVGSNDFREFVGAYVLALHQVFATIDKRYEDLELLPFGPTALILVTSEEVPQTVKRLSSRAGVVVLSSDDLFELLPRTWGKQPRSFTKAWVLKNIRSAISNIPKAVTEPLATSGEGED